MLRLTRRYVRLVPAVALTLSLALVSGCSRDPNVRKQKYLASAKKYEKDGKLREAVIQLSNALKLDKNYADAHYELAQTYLRLGYISASYNEMMRTVLLTPNNLKARIQVGNMQLGANLPDRAMEQVKAVEAVNPNYADAYALAANIAGVKGDYAEARKQIEHALALDPNRSEYHTTLAMLDAKDASAVPTAVQELQKAISLDGNNEAAHLTLGSLLEKSGDRAGAIAQVQAAIKVAPKDLSARRDLAGLYLRSNDRPRAEETLREASNDLADTPQGASVLSEYYLSRGELGPADSAYADLVGKNPKSFELRYAYARILVAEHKYDKAAKIADALRKESPKSAEVAVLDASLLLGDGKVKEAFELLQKATKVSPDNLQLLIAFAKVAQLRGDEVAAELSLEDAKKIAPGNLDVLMGLAEVANRKHDNNLLAQVAEETMQKVPTFPDSYVWRATAEANEKDFAGAKKDFGIVLARNPKNVNALVEMGQISILEHHVPEGMDYLEKALDADPNSFGALNLIVQYYFSIKQPDKAIARIRQQLDKVPNNLAFLNELATAEYTVHNYAVARDLAKTAVGINANDETAVQLYAQCSSALGDKNGAVESWSKWMAGHPADGKAAAMLGRAEEEKGDLAQAQFYYSKALTLDPGQAFASNNLAYLLVQQGKDLDTALRLAQDARSGLPNSPMTADTLAWVLYARGRYLSARDLLEEAVKGDPNNPDPQYHLGMTYRKLGDTTNAALHLKKAVALNPNSESGKDAAKALSEAN